MRRFQRILSVLLVLSMLLAMPAVSAAETGAYAVEALSVSGLDGGAVQAQILAPDDCTLLVAVYETDGRLSCVADAAVPGAPAPQPVALSLPDGRPEEYRLKAFLVDSVTYAPLSGAYVWGEDAASGDYAINGLTIEGGDVRVTVSTGAACTVLVQILSEDGNTILHGYTASAAENLQMAEVAVPAQDVFSGYFQIRAWLQDDQGNPLCNPYTTLQYTRAYQKFANQTPEDFRDNLVLDFQDSGFGVLTDGAVALSGLAVTEDDITYTVETQTLPVCGDVVLLTEASGAQTPVLVLSASDNGDGTVTIVRDQTAGIGDLYQVFRLDTTVDVGAAAQQGGKAQMFALRESGDRVDEAGVEFIKLGGSISASALTVKASVGVGLRVKAVYDRDLFGEDYMEFSCVLDLNGTASATVSGAVKSSDLKDAFGRPTAPVITLYKGPIALVGAGLAALQLEVSIPLEFSFSASGKAEIGIHAKTGFRFTPQDGCQPVRENAPTAKMELTGKFEIKTGPKVALNAIVILGALEGSVSGQAGVKVTGEMKKSVPEAGTPEKLHGCAACVDMTLAVFCESKGRLSYHLNKVLKGDIFALDLLSGSWTLGKAYFSVLNDADSLFEGKPAFGLGTCPNDRYLVTIATEEMSGKTVTGIPVSVASGGESKGSGSSLYQIYLYDGDYLASGEFASGTFSERFAVCHGIVTLILKEQVTMLRGTVTDAATGLPVEGARIAVKLPDGTERTALTNAAGGYGMSMLPAGVHTFRFTADGYTPCSVEETIAAGPDNQLDLSLTPLPVTLSGVVCDAEDGKPLAGATIVAVREGTAAGSTVSAADGAFSLALPAGTYTVSAACADYQTETQRVALDGDRSVSFALTGLAQPDDTVIWQGHRYRYYTAAESGVNWAEASANCQAMGGHLVTITSLDEQAFIESLVSGGGANGIWLNGCRSGDGFVWANGEPWFYQNWAPHQPDNYNNVENYLMMYIRANPDTAGNFFGGWNDVNYLNSGTFAVGNMGYVCEWDSLR